MSVHALTIAKKDVRDHLRDTRSLLAAAMYALMGPLVVLLISFSKQAGTTSGGANSVLLGMLSVFALAATFVGGTNVAMDAIAGERERRSLLPLLMNPMSRADVAIGKWLATCAFAVAGLVVNVVAFGALLALSPAVAGLQHVPLLAVWATFGLVPLTLFASAVELLISALCRTMKEAHTYLSLLVFLPMMVGMFLMFFPRWPGPWSFLVPIVGQQALIDTGLRGGRVSLANCLVLAAVTVGAAIPALFGTARVLDRDEAVGVG